MPTTEPVAFGPTHNPWDVTRSPGGSSGGAAAAVSSRMVPLAHATDSGGSIRIPSSACALVGLKPSRGLLVDEGATLGSLNVQHVVTRSVRDSAALLDVLAVSTPEQPFAEMVSAEPERLRVGLMTQASGGLTPVHPDCVAAAEDAAKLMESLGHAVERSYPAPLDEIEHIIHYGAITGADTAAKLDFWSDRTGARIGEDDVEPGTWALAEMGRAVTPDQLRASLAWCARFTPRVAAWWSEGFDLLLTPTLAEPPPPLGELISAREAPLAAGLRAGMIVPFTPPFNTTGQPAISLPLHWNKAGLPIGIQLVGAPRRDDLLVRVATQLERALPWIERHPPVSA
jgi:amidase